MPKAGLDLRSASVAYSDMVGVLSTQCTNLKLVDSSSPSSSYLINKLTGNGICFGSLMPKAGAALPASDIDVIRAWIGLGALNN